MTLLETQKTHNNKEKLLNQNNNYSLYARLLHKDQTVINPEKLNLKELKADEFISFDLRNYSLFNTASKKERQTNTQTLEKWKEDTLNLFSSSRDFFSSNQGDGKRWSEFISKTLKIDASAVKSADLDKILNSYFTGEKRDSNIKQFVKDIISAYITSDGKIDLENIKQNQDVIIWVASFFGKTSAEVINELIQAEVKLITDPSSIITEVNKKQSDNQTLRLNTLNPYEEKLLKFLWGNQKAADKSDEENINVDRQEIKFRETPRKVESLLRTLTRPLYKNNQRLMENWFIENPQNNLDLTKEQLDSLLIKPEPFFIQQDNYTITNDKINPQVWEFMVHNNEKTPEQLKNFPNDPDERFLEATELTNDDSSMLALSSISSETPEKQAQVYQIIADILVKVNELNPQQINLWLKAQGSMHNNSSLDGFINFDNQRKEEGQSDDYVLIPLKNNVLDENHFMKIWSERIKELRQAVDQNQFTMYHHRWIEVLSETVDIKKLILFIKQKGSGN